MVAINRVQKMIRAMIGQQLSESTLLSFVIKLHIALEKWEANAKEQIRALAVSLCDNNPRVL